MIFLPNQATERLYMFNMGGVLTSVRFTNMSVVNDGKTTMGCMFQSI